MLRNISNHKAETPSKWVLLSIHQVGCSRLRSIVLRMCHLLPFGAFQPLHEIFYLHQLG